MLKLSAICAFCARLHITGVESPRLPCQRAPVRFCHCEVHGEIRELEEKMLVFYSDKWLRDAANALNDFLESPTAVYGHPSSSSACSLGSHRLWLQPSPWLCKPWILTRINNGFQFPGWCCWIQNLVPKFDTDTEPHRLESGIVDMIGLDLKAVMISLPIENSAGSPTETIICLK